MNVENIPLVSIGVPTYNRETYLAECLKSCLDQTYLNLEIIVCDNASEDNTSSVPIKLNDSRIKYFRQPHPVSPIANWNSCCKLAKGEYITYISDDDILHPEFVETLIELAHNYPSASLWRSGMRCIDSFGDTLWEYNSFPEWESAEFFFQSRIMHGRPQFLPGFLCRRIDICRIGGFIDVGFPAMLYLDDYLWFRIAFRGEGVVSTNKILWNYRQHSSQYGGKGIDLDLFILKAPHYIEILNHLALENSCSSEIIEYLNTEYYYNLISTRVNIELRRQRNKSLIGYLKSLPKFISLASKVNVPINKKRLLMGIFTTKYL